jgi:uncharacterized membrane protein
MGSVIMLYLLLLIIGVAAGLRAATPLAALALGAYLGWIDLTGTWAAFAGNIITVVVLVLIAILELVGDQLPQTPSRKSPPAFTGRVIAGALAGTVLGLATGAWIAGLILGAIGAVAGTLGGFEIRRLMARAFGRDLPAALIEDAVAIVVALLVVWAA